jgi:hypothetical protein
MRCYLPTARTILALARPAPVPAPARPAFGPAERIVLAAAVASSSLATLAFVAGLVVVLL